MDGGRDDRISWAPAVVTTVPRQHAPGYSRAVSADESLEIARAEHPAQTCSVSTLSGPHLREHRLSALTESSL